MVKNCLYRMIAAFRHSICSVFLILFYISVSGQSSFDVEVQKGYSSSFFDITNRININKVVNPSEYKERMQRLTNSTYLVGIGYNIDLRHRISLTYRHHIIGSEVSPLHSNSNSFIKEESRFFELGFRYDFAPIKQLSIQVGPIINIFDRFDGTFGSYNDRNDPIISIRSSTLAFDKSIFKALENSSTRVGLKMGISYVARIDDNLSLFLLGVYQYTSNYVKSPGLSFFPHGTINEYVLSLGFRFNFYKFKKQ